MIKKTIKIIIFVILCTTVLTGCFTTDHDNSSKNDIKIKTVVYEYMKAKYQVDCEVTDYGYKKNNDTGKFCYTAITRLKDVSVFKAKESALGNSYVKQADQALNIENTKSQQADTDNQSGPFFYVFVDGDDMSVIGDQYMWFEIYPYLDGWITDNISRYAPFNAAFTYLQFTASEDWEYPFCFPADCPVISTQSEFENQMARMKMYLNMYVPYSEKEGLQNADWQPFEEQCDKFSSLSATVYAVDDKEIEKIRDTRKTDGVELSSILYLK